MDGSVLPPVYGASQPEAPGGGPEPWGLRQRASERAGELYYDFAQDDGTLPVSALGGLLASVDLHTSPDNCRRVVTTVAGPSVEFMTREQT